MSVIEVSRIDAAREAQLGHERIHVSSLPVGHAWRVAGLDERHIARLAANHASLPPVLVCRGDFVVVDGAHRVAAARRLGMHTLAVEWFEGSRTEAFAEFVRRNSLDGLAPSVEDRRRGVHEMLVAEPHWSDRRVAHVCGVSPKMVARMRGECGRPAPHEESKRVGRDGRARPVRSGTMRSEIADMLTLEPNASLRTIASRLGVSPETVRSVRRQLDLRDDSSADARLAMDEFVLNRLLAGARHAEPPTPWQHDNAFDSTETGVSFVDWFDSSTVVEEGGRVDEVPLSRVYEIADEARRRARFWVRFAEGLELRTRGRR